VAVEKRGERLLVKMRIGVEHLPDEDD